MDSNGVFICGGTILFIIVLFVVGIYLVTKRTPVEKEQPINSPLPYTQAPQIIGQPANVQPQVIYVQQAPKPRGLLSRPIDWIALAIIIIIAAGLIIPRLVGGYTPSEMGWHKITYQVRGTAKSVSVTLSNGAGGTEQNILPVPFHADVDMDYGSMVSLLAQKQSDAGTITCEVYDNDVLWLTSTSNAPYGICMVNGMVGYK